MLTLRKLTTLLATSTAALMMASAAQAQEIVNWVHIESNPGTVAVFEEIAAKYEAENSNVDVRIQFIDNESFKARLPTMLQSNDAPDIFFSWGGGVLAEQVRGGVVKDLTAAMDDEWRASLVPSAVSAFTIDGKVYGVPVWSSLVGMFYNKAMFAEAGVNADEIQTWSQFLTAVDKLKAAGLTPITVGGKDSWPQHFYFSYLAIRSVGNEKLAAALNGKGEGFNDPAFVTAFTQLKELADKEPFQNGWLASTFGDSAANFGNGKAAMMLQGDWARQVQINESTEGEGLEDDLGWFSFPQLEGGIANSKETFGGINGWLLFSGASDAAVDFIKFYSMPENAKLLATKGNKVPPSPGIAASLTDPWQVEISQRIEQSGHHQNFYNVVFSEDVNRELLDIVTNVMTGDLTPEGGADALQTAWEFSQ